MPGHKPSLADVAQKQGRGSSGHTQETNSPRKSEHSIINGLPALPSFLDPRAATMPPTNFSTAAAVNNPVANSLHLPQLTERDPGLLLARQTSLNGRIVLGPELSQQGFQEPLPAHQHRAELAKNPALPAPLSLYFPSQVFTPSAGAVTAMTPEPTPSTLSQEGTPATPSARQTSRSESKLEPWQNPPRRGRSGGRFDQGLWHLAAMAEAAYRSPSLVEELTGTVTASADAVSRARTDRRLARVELLDRNRSVTSPNPRPAGRATSSPSRQDRPTRTEAAARSQAFDVQRARSSQSKEALGGSKHAGEVRLIALDMVERGSSYEEVAELLEINAAEIRYWDGDKRRGPRTSLQLALQRSRRPPDAAESGKRRTALPENLLSAIRGSPSKSRSPAAELSSGPTAATRESSGAARAAASSGSRERRSRERTTSTITDEEPAARGFNHLDRAAFRGTAASLPTLAKSPKKSKPRSAAKAAAGGASANPAEELESGSDVNEESQKRRIKFSAEIRAEALRLHAATPSAITVASELERYGVKAHNVLNWASLQRRGRMNDQGHRFYPRKGSELDSQPRLYAAFAGPRGATRQARIEYSERQEHAGQPLGASAEIRARAIQLWSLGHPAFKIAQELAIEGVGSSEVLRWVQLHRIRVLNSQGHQILPGSGTDETFKARTDALEEKEIDPDE